MDAVKVWDEAMNYMEGDIHYYLHQLSPMRKEKIRGGDVVIRFEEKDDFHAIVLKLILIRESFLTAVHLRNKGYVYFAYAPLRFAFEAFEDIYFLLSEEKLSLVTEAGKYKEVREELLEAFYQEGEVKGGKIFYEPFGRGAVRKLLGELKEPWKGRYSHMAFLYGMFSKFVHGQASAIIDGSLAGYKNDDEGYTFGKPPENDKNLLKLTGLIWNFLYTALLLFAQVRMSRGADEEYIEKSNDLRRRFKEVGEAFGLNWV